MKTQKLSIGICIFFLLIVNLATAFTIDNPNIPRLEYEKIMLLHDYYTIDEIDSIIQDVVVGNISLDDYYNKTEIDLMLTDIDESKWTEDTDGIIYSDGRVKIGAGNPQITEYLGLDISIYNMVDPVTGIKVLAESDEAGTTYGIHSIGQGGMTGIGVGGYFEGTQPDMTGHTYGVKGIAGSTIHDNVGGDFYSSTHFSGFPQPNDFGVRGITNSDIGNSYGGYFDTSNTGEAMGVYGKSSSGVGESYGGYFEGFSESGITYGIYATATSGTTHYAGYFAEGDVKVENNLLVEHNITAQNFITTSNVMDINRDNNPLDNLNNIDKWVGRDGEIDYRQHYAHTSWEEIDYSRPEIKIVEQKICYDEHNQVNCRTEKVEIEYFPHNKTVYGLNLEKRVAEMEGMIYKLKQRIIELENEVNK